MRTPTLQEQVKAAALPPRPSPTTEQLLSDPRMERIRQEAPEKHAELVARMRTAKEGTTPRMRQSDVRLRGMASQRQAPPYTWEDVESDPAFADLNAQERERVRQGYFEDIVAPSGIETREEFDARTAPGFFERTANAVKGAIRGDEPLYAPPLQPGQDAPTPSLGERVQGVALSVAQGLVDLADLAPQGLNLLYDSLEAIGITPPQYVAAGHLPGRQVTQAISRKLGDFMAHLQAAKPDSVEQLESQQIIREDPNGWLSWGGKNYDVDLPSLTQVLGVAARSAPTMIPVLGVGGKAAKALQALGASTPVATAIGYGLPSAAVTTAQTSREVYDEAFNRLRNQKGPSGERLFTDEEADQLARQARLKGSAVVFPVAAITGGIGAGLAGLGGKSSTFVRRLAAGYAADLPPEAFEEGFQAGVTNVFGRGEDEWVTPETLSEGIVAAIASAPQGAAVAALEGRGAGQPTPTPPPGEPGAPPLQVLPPGDERLALPQTIPFRQGAPDARPGLPSPENLEEGAAAIYNDLLGQGMAEPEARAEVQRRIRAYRELRQARTIEVPAEEDLQPGEVVEVEEQPGSPTVEGIVAEITPEGMARIQVLSEDAAGQDFLSWVRSGMMGDLPTAEQIARYPGEPAPPEQDAWRVVEVGTGREMGSALSLDAANELAAQFGNAEVLPPRGRVSEQGQIGAQEAAGALDIPTRPSGQVQPDLATERAQGQQIAADLSPLAQQVERARAVQEAQQETQAPLQEAAEPAAATSRQESQAGDITFERNLELALPGLQRRANRLAGDPDRGADLLQDAMTRMWERRETYQPGEPFMPWAQTVLRSVHANRARTFSRRAEGNLDLGAEPGDIGVAPEQEARFDLEMEARESGALDVDAPQRGTEQPPAAEGRTQDAARQPAGQQQPEAPLPIENPHNQGTKEYHQHNIDSLNRILEVERRRENPSPALISTMTHYLEGERKLLEQAPTLKEMRAAEREAFPDSPYRDMSRAPLSEIAERRAALERQRRLEALAAQGRTGLSNAERAQARQRADALRRRIEQLDEAAKESEARAAQEIMAEARSIYAHEPPMLRLVNALESRAAGEYQAAKRMVTVSLEALDPVGTYNHEAMHDLRRWFLSPLENQALNSAFAPGSRASQEVMRTLRTMGYNEAAAQAAGSAEERIAHAFSLRRMGQFKPRPAVRRVLDKIGQWMERIVNLFAGRGFRSAEDVFKAIERGEVGARQRRDSGVQAPSRQESRAPLSESTRGRARRIQVPRREGEAATLGARAEEFQRNATARPLEDVLDYTVGRNTTRLNWPTEDINRAIAEWRRLTPENQRTTTWDETIRQAEKRLRTGDITEQSIMDWPEKKVPSAVEVAAGDILLSLRAEHLMKVARQTAQTGSKEDAARYQLFSAEFAYMQGKVHGAASEVARALNIMRARPDLLRDRDRAITSILEEAGGQDQLLRTAEMVASLDEPAAIKQFMEKKWKPNWWDRTMEVWINGILSNPATHVKNILGTRAFDLLQNPETLVAAALGRMRGDTNRVYAGEVAAGLYAEIRALPEAWKLAKHAYLTEQGSGLSKQEVRQSISHPLGKHLVRQPGRFLFAEDAFAKALAYRKELMRRAYRQAMKDGHRGEALGREIDRILQDPPADLHFAAMDYAAYVTFTRKAGPMAQAVMKFVDSMDIAGARPLKLILPFIRTPAQLLDVMVERSLPGVFTRSFKEAWAEGGAARDMAVARIAVGSGLLGTAFLLAGAGLLTGSGPADPREKEMWRLGGSPLRPGVPWQPNSAWVGYRYVSIAGLDPVSLLLGMAATFVETGERATTDEEDGIAGRLLGAFVKNVASKTWLQGITDAIEVMNDPDRYGEHWVRRMAGSVVPAGVAQAARMIDPNLREVETMLDAVRSRTPVWSKTLSPRINVKGEEIELQGAMGPDAFSPFYYAPEGRTGPVARELTALGITIGPSSQKINGHELTGKQLAEYRADRGARIWKRLEMTVNRPGWSTLSPDQKQRRIERAISFEGSAASGRMKHRYPELRRPKRLARGA